PLGEMPGTALGPQPLRTPQSHGNQWYARRRRQPPGTALDLLDRERTADRRLGEDADNLARLQCGQRRLVRAEAGVTVDRYVTHSTHQRPADAALEDLLLGHKPHQAAGRVRAVPAEDEVQVADVIAGDHSAAGTGDVFAALDRDPQVEDSEQ